MSLYSMSGSLIAEFLMGASSQRNLQWHSLNELVSLVEAIVQTNRAR